MDDRPLATMQAARCVECGAAIVYKPGRLGLDEGDMIRPLASALGWLEDDGQWWCWRDRPA